MTNPTPENLRGSWRRGSSCTFQSPGTLLDGDDRPCDLATPPVKCSPRLSPLLLPSGTDDNGPGFCDDDANLFLVVVKHEIVVCDSAVGCSSLYRAGAVRIHGIGARKGLLLG